MKKLFFFLIATGLFSTFSFANTSDIEAINFVENQETSLTKSKESIEDDIWFCYEIARTVDDNFMTGEVTVTITYKCTWYSL